MENENTKQIAAIILAAGKGKRMQLEKANKVTLPLAGRPIITHIVSFLKNLQIKTIAVVVGHHKESVKDALARESILFVEQKEQLGTGHALSCAIEVLPEGITDVLVVYGDDAVLYTGKNSDVIQKLLAVHQEKHNAITFLTIEQENPSDLGRIVRDEKGYVVAIVEEKDATDEQRKITEINPGCFLFSVAFLEKYLPDLPKSPVTGEYYLTGFIELAIRHNEKVEAVHGRKLAWRGVNTKEELQEAESFYQGEDK